VLGYHAPFDTRASCFEALLAINGTAEHEPETEHQRSHDQLNDRSPLFSSPRSSEPGTSRALTDSARCGTSSSAAVPDSTTDPPARR
jgi:hypothetical protein